MKHDHILNAQSTADESLQPSMLEPFTFEDVDLFAEGAEERFNAGTGSSLASTSSFSCAGGSFCSFGTIGSACTA
jgi:hypothetical protein